jgi:hypothetical protein
MDKERLQENTHKKNDDRPALKFLHPSQIAMIDEALAAVGEFGEVRLIVEKGNLRFIATQKSFDALKWQPGSLTAEARVSRQSL